jgi:hypothetical protein
MMVRVPGSLPCLNQDDSELELNMDLSPGQTQILKLLSQGKTMREVGQMLGVSFHTVRTPMRKAYVKPGVKSQVPGVIAFLRVQRSTLSTITKRLAADHWITEGFRRPRHVQVLILPARLAGQGQFTTLFSVGGGCCRNVDSQFTTLFFLAPKADL